MGKPSGAVTNWEPVEIGKRGTKKIVRKIVRRRDVSFWKKQDWKFVKKYGLQCAVIEKVG